MIISLAQLVPFTVYILTNHEWLLKPIHQAHGPPSKARPELALPLKLCRAYQLLKHLDLGGCKSLLGLGGRPSQRPSFRRKPQSKGCATPLGSEEVPSSVKLNPQTWLLPEGNNNLPGQSRVPLPIPTACTRWGASLARELPPPAGKGSAGPFLRAPRPRLRG